MTAPDCGLRILTRDSSPLLSIEYGHTEHGVLTVAMTVVPVARTEPMVVRWNGTTIIERNVSGAVRCDCPNSAESVLGGVHVRHSDGCVHGEPRRYYWQYAGTLYTGSLADYADHFQTLDPEAQHRLTVAGTNSGPGPIPTG